MDTNKSWTNREEKEREKFRERIQTEQAQGTYLTAFQQAQAHSDRLWQELQSEPIDKGPASRLHLPNL